MYIYHQFVRHLKRLRSLNFVATGHVVRSCHAVLMRNTSNRGIRSRHSCPNLGSLTNNFRVHPICRCIPFVRLLSFWSLNSNQIYRYSDLVSIYYSPWFILGTTFGAIWTLIFSKMTRCCVRLKFLVIHGFFVWVLKCSYKTVTMLL